MEMLAENSMLPLWRRINHAFITRGQRWSLPLNAALVLIHLKIHPEDDEPAILAEVTHFPRQTMTFALDTLERNKLAHRSPHAKDRRRKQVSLTAAGAQLADEMISDLRDFEARALATLPRDEVTRMRTFITGYADALTKLNEELN